MGFSTLFHLSKRYSLPIYRNKCVSWNTCISSTFLLDVYGSLSVILGFLVWKNSICDQESDLETHAKIEEILDVYGQEHLVF